MNSDILVIDSIKKGIELLESAKVPDASIDAWLLAEHVFGVTRQKYFMKPDITAGKEESDKYFELIDKRCSRIPLQHLTGTQEFMGFTFKVNENVLIPRQDTEVLVEKAVEFTEHLQKGKSEPLKILDMCTGSGCIAISLAKLLKNVRVYAVDLSEKALAMAKENAQMLEADVEFIHSDLFAKIEGKYDIIISNPPYIRKAVIETLMEEVKNHEPIMALDGEEDGLAFYRKISEEAVDFLDENGIILYEIGHDQGESVPVILERYKFEDIAVYKDLSGNDRVVTARKGE